MARSRFVFVPRSVLRTDRVHLDLFGSIIRSIFGPIVGLAALRLRVSGFVMLRSAVSGFESSPFPIWFVIPALWLTFTFFLNVLLSLVLRFFTFRGVSNDSIESVDFRIDV